MIDHDASYLYVTTLLSAAPTSVVRLGFDVVPGGLPLPGGGAEGQDVAVVLDPTRHAALACIRGDLDPLLLDGQHASDLPKPGADGWSLQQLSINRSFDLHGRYLPAEYFPVGELREGSWDAGAAGYDSRSTWRVEGATVYLRLPWSMLMLGDPSSRSAVIPVDGQARAVPVTEIGLLVDAGSGGQARAEITWEGWQRADYRERLKVGAQPIVDAWAALSRPRR